MAVSAAGCASAWLPAAPTESIQVSPARGATIAVETIWVGDDIPADGISDDPWIGVSLRIENRQAKPYRIDASTASLWLALDPTQPRETLSFSPIAAGMGEAPHDEVPISGTVPSIVVDAGASARAWIYFLGYPFAESGIPRRVTLRVRDGDGQLIQVVLADPTRGRLRWRIPARRSQTMIGFQSTQFSGAQFQGISPTTVVSRVGQFALFGIWLWDVGLVSGLAIQQQGVLPSSTSAFSILGVSAHLTAPLLTWGGWRNPRRVGLYFGGGEAAWIAVQSIAEINAGRAPFSTAVRSVDGGLEFSFGPTPLAPTPFPLVPEPQLALPRLSFRIGYTNDWFTGGSTGGLVTTARFAF